MCESSNIDDIDIITFYSRVCVGFLVVLLGIIPAHSSEVWVGSGSELVSIHTHMGESLPRRHADHIFVLMCTCTHTHTHTHALEF